jgi:hypothetical protein
MSAIPTPDAIEAELDRLDEDKSQRVRFSGTAGQDFAEGATRALRDRMTPGQVQSSLMEGRVFAGAMHAAWWRVGLRDDAPSSTL